MKRQNSVKTLTPVPRVVTRTGNFRDGLQVKLVVEAIKESHLRDFDLAVMRSRDSKPLLHTKVSYTVIEIPAGKAR